MLGKCFNVSACNCLQGPAAMLKIDWRECDFTSWKIQRQSIIVDGLLLFFRNIVVTFCFLSNMNLALWGHS